LPLGLVKLKKGTYSVELTSGGTTLTPFKAVVKPSALSIASDNIESDSTFQKLPQSNTEPIETTGNAALPDQVKLVTEDNKANLGKADTSVSADLPKSENKPLENQRSFLTVDQINGQKSVVFDNTPALESRNFNQDQDTGPEVTRFRTLAGSDQEFSNVSGNKPLPDTNEGFSSNQNFINNNSVNDQGTSFNNSLSNSQESTSRNAELPNSTPFGLSQDGRPISQNAPLGYTPDGVIISQSFELDQNGLPITQNRPLNGSVETFSTNTPLRDSESSGIIENENIQFGNASGQSAEYQKLPEAISVSRLDQPGNLSSGNAAFENFDQQSSSPGKLQESNLSGESKNNSFAESDGGVFSENQKLTDSTIFNSGVDSQSLNKNQADEYQQVSETNLNNNLGSSPSELIENNQVKNQSQTGAIYQSVGPDGSNTTQVDNKTAVQTAVQTAAQTVLPVQPSGEQIPSDNGVRVYQTRTVGSDDGSSADNAINSNVSNRGTDGIYNEDVPASDDFITQGIATSRVLSSSMGQQNTSNSDSNQYLSNDIIGKADQQNGQLDYVQVGNTYSAGGTTDTSKFNLDTDMPNDFYEYKGSRTISNEELLEEFLNSDEFKKLDEESKSRVINVKQEIQVQKDSITQSQQDDSVSNSVLSGNVLSGGQPIQDKSEPRGFAKLFTRNKQDRPVNRSQEQAQRQFEESNNLKQKVSLTLNKVFGNNEKTVSIPEYTIPDQQEQLQNSKFEDLNEDGLQPDDYQFGDEDNVINRYPRITGVREALDEDYQEDLRKRRRKRRNLRYLPVGSSLEPKFLQTSNDPPIESLPSDEESNIYRGLVGERDRFQNLTISEQEQNKIALRKAEHDIQQQLNKALEENIIIKENAENQASELSADSETMFYRELVKERERFQEALSEEREQNKAALRRSEEQIQRQLIDVLTTNPQASTTQSPNDPISQVVRSLVDSGKDKEEIIIDATRIIQMIQNNQTVAGGQEIDEFLLRQRIERELKYEFKQMQLDHEQKMRIIYRRMIEDMYIDMLNS
jgi:hypothetical protein